MADLRSLGSALEAYSVDFESFPRVTIAGASTTNWQVYLVPTYTRRIPELDGWQRQYLAKTSTSGGDYTIWSRGRAGTGAEGANGPRASIDDAIVYSDGTFIQWPEGLQAN